eukprot:Gb_06896 [translate_table: standard]
MRKFGYVCCSLELLLLLFQLRYYSIHCANQPAEDDIKCLQTVHQQLKDPEGDLVNWKFRNTTTGFTCNFLGIQCWHPDEDRVLTIKLPGLGLEGEFPSGLQYCRSMTNLDLSNNALSGTIPSELCKWVPYLVTLDLSQNRLTGPIPPEIYNCSYLNIIRLNDNQLSGEIPWQITRLDRLKELNVADNKLSGVIPSFKTKPDVSWFQNNPGLCGAPLSNKCSEVTLPRGFSPLVVAAFILYSVVAIVWIFLCFRWWKSTKISGREPPSKRDQYNSHSNRIRTRRNVKVSLFEKPLRKMTIADLVAATNDFSPDRVIWSGRSGTLYKATLRDGSVMAIKRLSAANSSQTEKEFKAEMKTLAHLRHRNIVPLLGYCVADEEKLLVYKYMANGTLLNCLHGLHAPVDEMDMPTKLKIGIGVARGLAWLHTCDPHVIHRNISSGIIFLDEEYEPRISGFRLATLKNVEDSRVAMDSLGQYLEEDFGYDAPEQWKDSSFATLKGDVYSYGVVLLELITQLKPADPLMIVEEDGKEVTLVEWIRHLLSKSECVEEATQKYVYGSRRHYLDHEITLIVELIRLASRCVNYNPHERPSMYEAYECLKKIGEHYMITDQEEELQYSFHIDVRV